MIKAIDRLFQRLGATYGIDFERSLGSTPISDAKTVWAHELSVFKNSLGRIAWALENLPDRCPNVIAFKSLCKQAPAPQEIALPAPKADPERIAAELAKLAPLMKRGVCESTYDPKAWAKTLRLRHLAAERLNANQIRCYRIALGMTQ